MPHGQKALLLAPGGACLTTWRVTGTEVRGTAHKPIMHTRLPEPPCLSTPTTAQIYHKDTTRPLLTLRRDYKYPLRSRVSTAIQQEPETDRQSRAVRGGKEAPQAQSANTGSYLTQTQNGLTYLKFIFFLSLFGSLFITGPLRMRKSKTLPVRWGTPDRH